MILFLALYTRLLRFSSTLPEIGFENHGLYFKYWSQGVLTRSGSMCVKNNMISIVIESHLEFGAKPVCNSNFYVLLTI